ncbi:hypothetical protein IGI04_026386 [Brassica rapa subsp. trilocularis]|uniref:Uncharacterized protein n=1 Tax=Brassica rapa subsp. trilocularis TaxID=1813537 RepID=A0ABQ7KW33_BRACM|nr:hypothetical protein IGI04_026386 [Brassica rapa subsp. trilocularis]
MANALVFLSDLQRGRSSSTLQVRRLRRGGDLMGVDMLLLDSQSVRDLLLRFWEARNMKSGGNHIGVDLLLLDAKVFLVKRLLKASVEETRGD